MRNTLLRLVAALLISSSAYAHSHVAATSPADKAVLAESPTQVSITFREIVRPEESSITVLDVAKHAVTDAKPTVGQTPKTLALALPELEAGAYTVQWNAVCMCADHHATHGQFHFTVK